MQRNIKKTVLGVAIIASIGGASYWMYRKSELFQREIERAIEKKVLTVFSEKWAEKVPFRLDRIRIDGRKLSLGLSMNDILVTLDGEIDASLSVRGRTLGLHYQPKARVQSSQSSEVQFKAEGDLKINAQLDPANPEALAFDISADFSPFSIQPKDRTDRMLGVGPTHLETKLSNQDIEVLLRIASLEALWDKRYTAFEKIPVVLTARTEGGLTQKLIAEIREPNQKRDLVTISTNSISSRRFQVSTSQISIEPWVHRAAEWFSISLLENLSEVTGTVAVKASVDLGASPEKILENFDVRLRRFGARLKEAKLQLKDWSGSLKPNELSITEGKIGLRKIVAQVNALHLPLPLITETRIASPISFKNLALAIGPLQVQPTESIDTLHVSTSAKLAETSIGALLDLACIEGARDLPASVKADFSTIELEPAMLDLTGKLRTTLFGGFFDIDDITVFDFLDEVPETQFSAFWNEIKLDQAATWAGFGKIDGILFGHAKDVVLEKLYPTHFDFLISARPHRKGDIVFSPDAMKNFVRIVAEDALDQIPKFAQFFAFGWPSRVFGGYDVDYAGISMLSTDGAIMLETLDPKEVYQKQEKHFILYGNRFKMPLESHQYPVILDATVVGNFVHRVVNTLTTLRKSNTNPAPLEESKNDPLISCQPHLE